MATYKHNGGTGGQPALARTPYLLEEVIDFAVVAGDVTIGSTDTFRVLNIPAYTWVSSAGWEVLTAESGAATSKMELGDGGDTDRWVAAAVFDTINVASTPAATTSALGWYVGSTADTIDLLSSVAAATNGKLRVWAVCVDTRPEGNTTDSKTWSTV